MRRALFLLTLTVLTAGLAFGAFPRLFSVDPGGCAPGGEATAAGQNLTGDSVAKLFLTAGGNDVELEVIEQSADSIKFRVPDGTAHGHYNLMVQTAGDAPALMEQPVQLEVADAETLAAKAEEEKRLEEELSAPVEPAPEEPQR